MPIIWEHCLSAVERHPAARPSGWINKNLTAILWGRFSWSEWSIYYVTAWLRAGRNLFLHVEPKGEQHLRSFARIKTQFHKKTKLYQSIIIWFDWVAKINICFLNLMVSIINYQVAAKLVAIIKLVNKITFMACLNNGIFSLNKLNFPLGVYDKP